MDLFESQELGISNLLPYDGTVEYYGDILGQRLSDDYFNDLLKNIVWQNDKAIIMGKEVITKRKVAWYANKPFKHSYSGVTKTALHWNESLLELKQIVEDTSKETFNSCLLNLYHNGEEGMAWHSDSEKALK